ncbi:phosphoribosylglycinamide formyltransferase [Alteromonas gilva]|uniref:Phosphoribosylglycinamide formyltransferase n=1 Tax=Alteromonas gilva TaxID=2987522 RepID=A0ABT5L5Y1_9ALTE|nr:phosphoribosylglycinamide formyltransferase [Alteromonas gilva]MDC8831173.1 phosphoribosylglycinamide formyltransferase [Alteromonas gilva]
MTTKPNICVLISGNGSNLQAIIDGVNAGKINANIACVIANRPDAYGLERAREAGIEAVCLDHKLYSDRQSYDIALREALEAHQPKCVVLAGFMRILTSEFVEHFSGRLLNIHPSLLPKYKGLNTHQRALDNNDDEHGLSVHFVTPELDGGPVIIQCKVPVFADDNAEALAQRVQEQERSIYPLVVHWFCSDRLKMNNNKALLDGKVLPDNGYANE